MKTRPIAAFRVLGGISFTSGVVILGSVIAFQSLPSLRGLQTTTFLAYFLIAGVAYSLAVYRLGRDQLSLKLIWGFAILFRLILLFNPPTLSDDVYRYIWDGHLLNNGVNPYLLPVNSVLLDAYDTPLRLLVNHDWMASPYLPVAQWVFALVTRIAPQNMLVFQITAAVFDLLTGWLVLDLLKFLRLPRQPVLVYLWNPLVIVEFAHGAHADSLMILLLMAAFWFLARTGRAFHHRAAEQCRGKAVETVRGRALISQHCCVVLKRLIRSASAEAVGLYASAISLAASTLTKPLSILLVPLFLRRWRLKGVLLYIGLILAVLALFAIGAGWGLSGDSDGTGIFGATRIYLQWWNYNAGIYHWLEVLLSGYQTPGAVPVELVGEEPILLAKTITTGLLGMVVLVAGWLAWKMERDQLDLLRLALVPLGAYLLFTPTVHPWYLTVIIPLLPFMLPRLGESSAYQHFIWPWIYFSVAVAISYLTYYDPDNLREYTQVRLIEYIPTYGLLVWALAHSIWSRKKIRSSTI